MRTTTWVLIVVALVLAITVLICAGGLGLYGLYERSQAKLRTVEAALPDGLRLVQSDAQLLVTEGSGFVVAPAWDSSSTTWPEDLSLFEIERWNQACIFKSRAPWNDDYQYLVRFDDGAVTNSLADLEPLQRAYKTKSEAVAFLQTGVPNSTLLGVYTLE